MSTVAEAVAAGDLDALIRVVDGLCAARDWDGIVDLRDRCRHALEERGLQLWPAAAYAEYRLALEAPATHAGPVVVDDAGRFALGPLWEVAAVHHAWSDLAPHVPSGPARALAAHERVLRGEDLAADPSFDHQILEIPAVVHPWEPGYPLADYRASRAEFPAPPLPAASLVALPASDPVRDDEEAVEALIALAAPWRDRSNGSVEAVAVDGTGSGAIAALGHREVALAEIGGADAMAWFAWAGASGGAYGRRRGGPMGRFAAWWTVATLAGLDWPPDPDDVAAALGELRWWWWEDPASRHGWSACLAVEDPEHGLAWAVRARDDRREDDPAPPSGQPAT